MDTVTIRAKQIEGQGYIAVEKYLRNTMKEVNASINLENVEAAKVNAANFYFSIPTPSLALAEKCKRLLPSEVCSSPRSIVRNGKTAYMLEVKDIEKAALLIKDGTLLESSLRSRSR
jgi:hypothetical protein